MISLPAFLSSFWGRGDELVSGGSRVRSRRGLLQPGHRSSQRSRRRIQGETRISGRRGLSIVECTLILTSSRPELYYVGSHRKKKTLFKSKISVAVHPTVSTEGTVCLFWSPEPDFGRNWSWWFQCTFDYGQTPSSTNPGLPYKSPDDSIIMKNISVDTNNVAWITAHIKWKW